MDFLNDKEYFVTTTEKFIDDLKQENAAFDAKISLNALKKCHAVQAPYYQEVLDWLLLALENETVQDAVEPLTTEQTRYAHYLIQSVYETVTMVI